MIKSAKRLLSGASYQKFRYVMKNTAISIVGLLLCSLEFMLFLEAILWRILRLQSM